MESVSFKLPAEMIARLEGLARDDDVSVGQVIRAAVDREFRRRDALRMPPRVCQRLLAPVRARVCEDFEAAQGWSDLRDRLVAKGYTLRESGGGLALHEAISGRFLCRTSEIGFGYPALLNRFSQPFPGHSHTWLLDRIREVPVYVKS
ncbi:ribbon-helix-helix protein, CopG family [Maritimibacter sp. HL-12]|uniref:ribbon-helix-helix protein, CopG family n=1 Tax=Maritimibacter sp. HL-12 TaxID=1162418 RepID=UPI000A0F06E0|nr:ribbon-helix-helix protein, CopG family [Maritimibacter sp. HL-12]SMH45352.1 Ribbon-helix-helix protein, copG family [Maritimibacter sp. HL-12]